MTKGYPERRRLQHPATMALEIRYICLRKRALEGANELAPTPFTLHRQSASYAAPGR
jgi:hypothetical protein